MHPPTLGTRLGPFVVRKLLKHDATGCVLLAEHVRLGTRNVLKVLHPGDPVAAKRFWDQARVLATVRHRNIVPLWDLGQLPSGHAYLVMPYIVGETLAQHLAAHGPFFPHQVLSIAAPLCAALAAVHAAGVVHRDVSPANVLLAREPDGALHVTLLDFEIAKLPEGSATQSGAVLGTPPYMAAEQIAEAATVDARCDLFSLGALTYQLLTGRLPFGVASAPVIYHRQHSGRPAPIPNVPQALSDTVLRALALAPGDRPSSAAHLAWELAAAIPAAPPMPSGTTILATTAPELLRPRARRRALLSRGRAKAAATLPPSHHAHPVAAAALLPSQPGAGASAAPAPLPGSA